MGMLAIGLILIGVLVLLGMIFKRIEVLHGVVGLIVLLVIWWAVGHS